MENMFDLDVQVTTEMTASRSADLAVSWTILETMTCPTRDDCA
ncbi:FDLD family class I lanthipeptide [Tumebacillus sp. ITR2]|uniref:FDLD family class I lanthipeptide n=1 Tax=Tumebacillus amylolyticus TaxID=2801339 RepID=A0ABS1J4K3_9BACL|nr:FDLD family class I lanthipeptide [Tumebacillus amylolyticus]MBL0385202.1 FDLD family class I lanthipeptide [Tumebacillus amylolyticus]